jgi:hypothetical protein
VEGQPVLVLDLFCDLLPAVAFEVSPEFYYVDHATALQGFVSHIKTAVVGGALFVEEIVGVGSIAAVHEADVFAQEEGALQGDHQGFVWVEGDRVHVLEGA